MNGSMRLFAGAGGGLLADLIIGHNPVCAVEWEPYACRILRERAAEGWFPDLRVYEGDVRMFDPSEHKGRIHTLHAGFPCTDISVAGKQIGVGEGTRSGLYREVLRIAGEVRPRELFLENVSAILSNGLGTVLGDLAALGYDAKWICIRASDVGANHQRDRWWLLARQVLVDSIDHTNNPKSEQTRKADGIQIIGRKEGFPRVFGGTSNDTEVLANTYIPQCERRSVSIGVSSKYADTSIGSWWKTECLVGRISNGMANRMDKLKTIGNGQVPLQADLAYTMLSELSAN